MAAVAGEEELGTPEAVVAAGAVAVVDPVAVEAGREDLGWAAS